MAVIRPFKGIFYNQEKIEIEKVVAPPYDIICEREVRHLCRQSAYNIVRLIAGRILPLPFACPEKDRYTQAKELFYKWLKKGILIEADKPAIYIYRQDYSLPFPPFEKKSRIGFLCLLRLTEKGKGVFPHEATFSFAVKDRQRLLEECKANFSPIFGLYEDKKERIREVIEGYLRRKRPEMDFYVGEIRHLLWTIEREEDIQKVITRMRGKPVFIADGHHRYTAALNFHQQVRTKESSFVLLYLAEMREENISILPTHRIVFSEQKGIVEKIARFCQVERIQTLEEKNEQGIKMYYQGNYYLLLPSCSSSHPLFFLHQVLIRKALGIKAKEEKEKICYTHSVQEGLDLLREREGIVFFVPSLRLEEIKKTILKGENLPRKSTYFYPKLLTGLVMRRF